MKTSRGVRVGDAFSKWLITVGGIGTILAVCTVFIFLVWVAVPLLFRASTGGERTVPFQAPEVRAIQSGVDEYNLMLWTLFSDGTFRCIRLDGGGEVLSRRLFEHRITASSSDPNTDSFALGFEDGAVRIGRIRFLTGHLDWHEAPETLREMPVGGLERHGNALVERSGEEVLRSFSVEAEFEESMEGECAVTGLAHVESDALSVLAVLFADGRLLIERLSRRTNLMTGKTTIRRREAALPYVPGEDGDPAFMKISGLGDSVVLAWRDGKVVRYNTRDPENPEVEETLDILPESKAELTGLIYLLGQTTLLAADTEGRVAAWFPVNSEPGDHTASQTRLVRAHVFGGGSVPVSALASSSRMRAFACAYADGSVRLYHVTSEKMMAEFSVEDPGIQEVLFSPRDDAVVAFSDCQAYVRRVDLGHPEASVKALFTKVWYEGAREPAHVWQSSSGTDDFEPKFGLIPLIFGTLKATLYSVLFGVPIALLAAVFTSEFMAPRVKLLVKPTVEMMAGLPSVVLGFLAALVFAPWAEGRIPELLGAFFMVPVTFLAGAYLWQLMPYRISLRLGAWRFLFILAMLPLGLLAAVAVGPCMERLLFAGDIKRWLDGQIGTGFGGWFLMLLPLSSVAVVWAMSRLAGPYLREHSRNWTRGLCAVVDLIKFLVVLLVALALCTAMAQLLTALGFDLRGGVFGTYVQRNALIVGFVMGFAIIPIIYTIAEDALGSVPDHLRSASLGAGATPWQTAVRIVIPTAMSGLFSAIMIGLGRAVGETMIVLMAAGNTPLMEWNLFNGFRTLSANIAVELPEAVRNSTHYRTLFLAALVLFVMTFILNTAAEMIRLRFRKKAVEL